MSVDFPKRVTVSWLDTVHESGWRSRMRIEYDALDDDLVHHSCGFLIADTDEYVQVALSWRGENEQSVEMFADTLTIPRSAVVDGPKAMR